jgi:hypothetical protein
MGFPDVMDPTLFRQLSKNDGKVVIPTRRPLFTPQKYYFSVSGIHFC